MKELSEWPVITFASTPSPNFADNALRPVPPTRHTYQCEATSQWSADCSISGGLEHGLHSCTGTSPTPPIRWNRL